MLRGLRAGLLPACCQLIAPCMAYVIWLEATRHAVSREQGTLHVVTDSVPPFEVVVRTDAVIPHIASLHRLRHLKLSR